MYTRAYSVREAAFMTEHPGKVLTREFDEGVLNSQNKAKAPKVKMSAREFTPEDLRYFRLMKHWENDLSPDGRLRVYRSVRSMSLTQKILEVRNARYDMAPIDAELKVREASLEALKRKFVDKDGDVFLRVTGIDPVTPGKQPPPSDWPGW